METRIFFNGGYRNIKPDEAVNTTRRLTSFCLFNGIRNALLKSQGGWYWLHRDGTLQHVARTLYSISFQNIYDLKGK